MARLGSLAFVLGLCLLGAVASIAEEEFSEELVLRPLPDGGILAHFHFTNRLPPVESYGVHHRIFPKAIFQLIRKFRIRDMELSFTQGRWDYQRWGSVDPIAQVAAKPVGVELSAAFDVPASEVDVTWGNLTNALSGLFCASLNFLESPAAYMDPWFSFKLKPNRTQTTGEQRIVKGKQSRKTGTRYGALPREAFCTENLTPWLKLLPCRDKAGLAELMHRETIYGGSYRSLRLAVVSGEFDDSLEAGTVLEQSLTVVIRDRGMPNLSLSSIFGVGLTGSCPLAKLSNVFLEVKQGLNKQLSFEGSADDAKLSSPDDRKVSSADNNAFELTASPDETLASDSSDLLEYRVPRGSAFDIGAYMKKPISWSPLRAEFRVSRFLTGNGAARGSIVVLLQGHLAKGPCTTATNGTEIAIMQMVPWYVRLYGHTLQVLVDGQSVDMWSVVKLMRFTPAEDRKSPAAIEMALYAPANTRTLAISVEYDKGFLHIDEHPPDANRGFDLPAALVTFPNCRVRRSHLTEVSPLVDLLLRDQPLRVYSEVLLMPLATPDFSMPYNVITFTCTVLALYFGSLLNVLRRRIGEEERKLKDKSDRKEVLTDKKKKLLKVALVAAVAVGVKYYLDTS